MRLPTDWRSRAALALAAAWALLAATHARTAQPFLLEPTLMGPPYVADVYLDADANAARRWPWQRNPAYEARKRTDVVTCVLWTRMENQNNFAQPLCAAFPKACFQGPQPCETFLGPESGTGSKTWPAAIPAEEMAPNATRNVLAYNLTCSDEAILSFGGSNAITNAPGAHLGVMAYCKGGADVTLATEGTWDLEVAWPKHVECYSTAWVNADGGVHVPVILGGDQWGCVFMELGFGASAEEGCRTLQAEYRTYYPDGCSVTNDTGAVAFKTSSSTMRAWKSFTPGDCIAPFAVPIESWAVAADKAKPITYHGYGPKLFHRRLTEDERAQIVAKDAAVMLRRGLLAPDSLHPGAHTALARARAVAGHTHSPGLQPPLPPALGNETEASDTSPSGEGEDTNNTVSPSGETTAEGGGTTLAP